jgi:hypothetical protein
VTREIDQHQAGASIIEDLAVNRDEAAEVKGGPLTRDGSVMVWDNVANKASGGGSAADEIIIGTATSSTHVK